MKCLIVVSKAWQSQAAAAAAAAAASSSESPPVAKVVVFLDPLRSDDPSSLQKMVNGAKVEFWTCVSFSQSNLDADRFCSDLISMCSSKGMEFNPRPLIPINYTQPGGGFHGLA